MTEDDLSRDEIKRLDDRLRYLESVTRETVARLFAIEKRLGLAAQSPPPRPAERPVVDPVPPPRVEPVSTPPQRPREPVQSSAPSVQPPASVRNVPAQQPWSSRSTLFPTTPVVVKPPTKKNGGDLETRIGGNWLNRIGIIALVFGMAFFTKYAFDNQWVGPRGRVLICAALGIALLIGGERLRKKYASYAYGLTGGGVLLLYVAIWAASFKHYDLIKNTATSFVLMAGVTAIASLLAARYNALAIAVLALIGGFLTPILLSTGVDNEVGLFGYIALLDAGVLALAYSKQWRSLNYMSFGATVLMFGGWMDEWYSPEKLQPTIFFLTLFFIIFALLAVLYNVVNKRPTGWLDLIMVFLNASLYFGASYGLLDEYHHGKLGAFAVLISAFYLVLGYITNRRDREDTLLIYTFLGLAFLFAVLAVPIQFDQHWVTMAWAVEGVVMTWIALKVNDRISRYAGVAVFAIAAFHWFAFDMQSFAYHAGEQFTPLLNRRALSCAVLVAALAIAAWLYKRYGENVEGDDRAALRGVLVLAANSLALTLLSLDVNDYFRQLRAIDYVPGRRDRMIDNRDLTLSALWALYAAGALITGLTRKLRPLRIGSLVVFALATAKVLLSDQMFYDAPWHMLIFNQTFAAFVVLIGALACGAWYYARTEGIDDERGAVLPALIGIANVLAVIAFSSEALGYFSQARSAAADLSLQARIDNNEQFTLSAIWIVYGATALTIGFKRKLMAVRAGALFLLSIAGLKLLVVDLGYYDAAWHALIINPTFASFALLIWALALGAWLYSRATDVDDEERRAALPLLVVAANLFAIIALSAEALGYYAAQLRVEGLSLDQTRDLRFTQQLALSLVWMVYAGVMLTIGILRSAKLPRIMALLLLGLTIVKVFFYDLNSLERLPRIISFIVLGVILLIVSFLYQRLRQRGEPSGEPTADDPPMQAELSSGPAHQ